MANPEQWEEEFYRRYGLTLVEAIDELLSKALHLTRRDEETARELVFGWLVDRALPTRVAGAENERDDQPRPAVQKPRAFLSACLANYYRDLWRKEQRRRNREELVSPMGSIDGTSGSLDRAATDRDEPATGAIPGELLELAKHKLPSRDAEIVKLRFLEDLDANEIAIEMDLSAAHVRKIISKSLAILRCHLEGGES